jgi:hypothetical protein
VGEIGSCQRADGLQGLHTAHRTPPVAQPAAPLPLHRVMATSVLKVHNLLSSLQGSPAWHLQGSSHCKALLTIRPPLLSYIVALAS